MNAKIEKPTYTFTQPCRIGFCNLIIAKAYEPKPGMPAGDPRFDATFILEPDSPDLAAVKDLIGTTLRSLNPGKKLVARRLTEEELRDGGVVEINVPWFDGTRAADKAKAEKESGKKKYDQEFMRGKIGLKAGSKYAPVLAAIENGKVSQFTDPATRAALASRFYSGAWVAPLVAVNAYPSKGDPRDSGYKPGGSGLWLNSVCFIKHDKKLIGGEGGVNAAEVFKGYAGQASTVDPGSNDEF